MNTCSAIKCLLYALLLSLLLSCAGKQSFLTAEGMLEKGDYDQAVNHYYAAVAENPQSHEYRMRLQYAKNKAALEHLKKGRAALDGGDIRGAAAEFGQAKALDPSLVTADQELQKAQGYLQAEELIDEAEEFYRARKFPQAKGALLKAMQLSPEDPRAAELMGKVQKDRVTIIDGQELDVTSQKPITLKFKEADLRDVFDILSKLSGINFIMDEDIRSQKVSVLLEEASFAQALELLLNLNSLEKRILNNKTIIVYPRTKEKEKQFEDKVIQTFYLSNIEAKKAVNLLRTMLQLRKIYVHEELNALVVRDSPKVIKLAQQVLEAADRPGSEVVFDLELIEVSRGDDTRLGPQLSRYQASLGFAKEGSDNLLSDVLTSSTENLASGLGSLDTFYTIPSATFDFAKTLTDTELLANPKIRVRNKQKAKVHIGSREPVITVTINGDNRSDNVQYVDVGVKLNVEPDINLDGTVVTKMNLEVSSISDRQELESGSAVFTITTTNAESVLTLKDGERTVIGGLIRDDLSTAKTTIPFLGDLPVLGKLFTNYSKNKGKREILLSITPHIVRSLDMPHPEVATIWSGGEDDFKVGPSFGSFLTSLEPEAEQAPILPTPSVRPAPPVPPMPEIEVEEEPQAQVVPAQVVDEAPAPVPPAVVGQRPGPAEPVRVAPVVPTVEPPAPVVAPPPAPAPAPQVSAPPPEPEPVKQVALPSLEAPQVAQKAQVFLDGPKLLGVGEEFSLEIRVSEIMNLYSAPLFVNFDAARLEFVNAEEGDFLRQGGQTTIFTSSANPEKGQLIIGYKQGLGGQGATGGGTLARLVFRAKAAGTASLDLNRVNFRNPGGTRISVSRSGISVQVR